MENLKATRNPNPEKFSNFFSKLFFFYTRGIFSKGYQKSLTEYDLYEVLPAFQSKTLGHKLESDWTNQNNQPSLVKLLWRCFGKEYLLLMTTLIIPMTTTILQPKFIKKFLLYFTPSRYDLSKADAAFYGVLLALILFVRALYLHNFQLRLSTFSLKIRTGLTCLIFRKIFKMESLKDVGKIITLVTRDVQEFEESVLKITNSVRDFCRLLMICSLLYSEIGWLFLCFLGIVITIILTDSYLAFLVQKQKSKTLKKSDERYQIIKEVLSSIKLVKLYLWNEFYEKKVSNARKREVHHICKIYILLFIKFIISETVSDVSWYILVVISICFGTQSNAGTLFLVMNAINIFGIALRYNLPSTLHEIATMIAVIKRIENFLKSIDTNKINLDLKIPNFKLNPGVTIITGATGSGKSLLLRMIAKGQNASYASQEPWIFPSTIKQNILFGRKFEEGRYLEVLRVCALLPDLEKFKEKDDTVLADKGTNLSKGQQVRINLARAVYKNCDVYLLDDCLSNLDVLVSNFIFEECFKKFLGKNVVVMVTQNTRFIDRAQMIVEINDSEIILKKSDQKVCKSEIGNIFKSSKVTESRKEDILNENSSLLQQPEVKKIYVEEKGQGKVPFQIYKTYFEHFGKITLLLSFFLLGLIQFLKSAFNKLENDWINSEEVIFKNTSDEVFGALQKRHQMFYLLPVLITVIAVLMLISTKLFWTFSGKASIFFHRLLFSKVLNSSMEFFQERLIGTILNRFSEDVLYLDEVVPYSMFHLMKSFLEVLGMIILISTVRWKFLFACSILILFTTYIRTFYLKTGRQLKRLEFSTRSPLIGYVTSTLDGLSTITMTKSEKTCLEEFNRHQDLYTSASYMNLCCEKGFHFFIDLLSVPFIGTILIIFLWIDYDASAGDVGLVLSQLFRFAYSQYFLYRWWTKLENQMTTIERILEYTKQKQESKSGCIINGWPWKGEIFYTNVDFSYSTQDSILKNLNFSVKSKEKVAIVGRTGSGKTSLISALFRLFEVEGKIFIDGVNITTLHLDLIRSKISIIPQEPILFSGSLRENIDPEELHKDEEIWKCLRSVKLNFESLDQKIENLSVGQKQLICLCRALVRKSKIVIFDEVTASLDFETELLIRNLIFEEFCNSTVITVAHKLNHVLNYDRILVLEDGRISQFGTPSQLLKDPKGKFYEMYQNQLNSRV